MHEDELLRTIERQWTEQDGLDDAEHRAARADAKGESEHDETRGAATSPHRTHAEREVLPKHTDRGAAPARGPRPAPDEQPRESLGGFTSFTAT